MPGVRLENRLLCLVEHHDLGVMWVRPIPWQKRKRGGYLQALEMALIEHLDQASMQLPVPKRQDLASRLK
jgi:hypothetical protein